MSRRSGVSLPGEGGGSSPAEHTKEESPSGQQTEAGPSRRSGDGTCVIADVQSDRLSPKGSPSAEVPSTQEPPIGPQLDKINDFPHRQPQNGLVSVPASSPVPHHDAESHMCQHSSASTMDAVPLINTPDSAESEGEGVPSSALPYAPELKPRIEAAPSEVDTLKSPTDKSEPQPELHPVLGASQREASVNSTAATCPTDSDTSPTVPQPAPNQGLAVSSEQPCPKQGLNSADVPPVSVQTADADEAAPSAVQALRSKQALSPRNSKTCAAPGTDVSSEETCLTAVTQNPSENQQNEVCPLRELDIQD